MTTFLGILVAVAVLIEVLCEKFEGVKRWKWYSRAAGAIAGIILAVMPFLPRTSESTATQGDVLVATDSLATIQDLQATEESVVSVIRYEIANLRKEIREGKFDAARNRAEQIERTGLILRTALDSGLIQLGLGKYEIAISKLSIAVQFASDIPTRADAFFYSGEAFGRWGAQLRDQNKLDSAQMCFANSVHYSDSALSYNHTDAEAWNNRGASLNGLGRHTGAIASFDSALIYKSGFSFAWYNRGNAFHGLKNDSVALANYDSAIAHQHDYANAWHNRGNALMSIGRVEDALKSFDSALVCTDPPPEVWISRGSALRRLGLDSAAIVSYDRALSYDDSLPAVWNNRGIALNSLQRYGEAVASYDKALSFDHDYPIAWYNRAIALDSLHQYTEAVASYDSALIYKRDYYKAWINKGALLCFLGRFEDALACCDSCLVHSPNIEAANELRQSILQIMEKVQKN